MLKVTFVTLLLCVPAVTTANADESNTIYRGTELLAFCESVDAQSQAHCEGFMPV